MSILKTINPLAIILLATTTILSIGCDSAIKGDVISTTGLITGKFSGVKPGSVVILKSYKNDLLIQNGRTTTSADGTFEIMPNKSLKMDYHQIMINKKHPIILLTDSTENLNITAHIPQKKGYLIGATFSGSPSSALLSDLMDVIIPLQDSLNEIQTLYNSSKGDENLAYQALMISLINDINAKGLAFIKTNPSDLAALEALKILNPGINGNSFKQVLKDLNETFGNTHTFQKQKSRYDSAQQPRVIPNQPPPTKNPAVKRTKKNNKYAVGVKALDIVMSDPSGNTRRLSDLRGKVVLLDFWASWCGPCRRENPHVVHAYEKYKGHGFEVFSVSLDSDKSKWMRAIQQDGLVWDNHVSDLRGWKNAASQAYGISSIPHTMLIGKDGVIIQTHLRGRMLEEELLKLFGE
jgi:thiol-disulfide isomerase/thioredoxin